MHDRELGNVPAPERRRIRRLQRGYVEQWVGVLGELRPAARPACLRAAVHATFGLLNSTPHSADELPPEAMTELLLAMGRAALLAEAAEDGAGKAAAPPSGRPRRGEAARRVQGARRGRLVPGSSGSGSIDGLTCMARSV